ncbi:unnamed protein product, partial [Nesidiocoris tenuis]
AAPKTWSTESLDSGRTSPTPCWKPRLSTPVVSWGGGGKMRAALLERQVNPLGTVITLPTNGSTPPPLQFILPAEVLHPSMDRPSTSRQNQQQEAPSTSRGEATPVDYLNLALPCVPCVINPLMESGSPPYVPAPLNEPELPDPFLEVMEDAGRPSSSQISSGATAAETKTKGKTRKKKHSVGDKPKGKPPPSSPPATVQASSKKDVDSGPETKESKNPITFAPEQPKPAPRKNKHSPPPADTVQSASVSSTSDSEVREIICVIPDQEDPWSCDVEEPTSTVAESVSPDPLRHPRGDGELILEPVSPVSFLQSQQDSIGKSLESASGPDLEVEASLCEPSDGDSILVEPSVGQEGSLINLSNDKIDQMSSGDVDIPEGTPNDSESNSEPITAVNISRDTSITDIRSEAADNEAHIETEVNTEEEIPAETDSSPAPDIRLDVRQSPPDSTEKVIAEERPAESVSKKPVGQPVKKMRSAGKNKFKRREFKVEVESDAKDDVTSTSCESDRSEIPEPLAPESPLSLLDEPMLDLSAAITKPLDAPFASYSAAVSEGAQTSSESPDFSEMAERWRQTKLKNKSECLDRSSDKKPAVEVDSSSETAAESRGSAKGTSTSNTSNHESSDADLIELKRSRRERTKKLKSAESLEEIKKKSPSPSKADVKLDTDSSDEAIDKSVEKLPSNPPKQVKRKKGKKADEVESPTSDVKLRTKSKSEGTLDSAEKSDYETCSEKKSDSSIESFTETKKRQSDPNGNFAEKSWSSIVKKEPPAKASGEDRDSVYESCNDEIPEVDSVAFESSKEDFEEPKVELVGESSSSNAEEKTEDSGDKEPTPAVAEAGKKVKKQKRKRR